MERDSDEAEVWSNRQSRGRGSTEWVEDIRKTLREHVEQMEDEEVGPQAGMEATVQRHPDESALICSVIDDLGILSHNLAVHRENDGVERGLIDIPDYHHDSGARR